LGQFLGKKREERVEPHFVSDYRMAKPWAGNTLPGGKERDFPPLAREKAHPTKIKRRESQTQSKEKKRYKRSLMLAFGYQGRTHRIGINIGAFPHKL